MNYEHNPAQSFRSIYGREGDDMAKKNGKARVTRAWFDPFGYYAGLEDPQQRPSGNKAIQKFAPNQ